MKTRKNQVLLVAFALFLFIVSVAALHRAYRSRIGKTMENLSHASEYGSGTMVVDGVAYKADTAVRSYLFLGVDDEGLDYHAFGRGGRTDTILLLVKRGGELTILEINRDTMTQVDTYDTDGDYLSSGEMQINMQYAYGDSPRRSAYLTKRTVSQLLGGVEIHGAMALNMSGIAPVVDALGGITVRMEEDCSYIDPDYTQDAEITMDGQAAERFIRWRDSNEGRMSRHSWFLRQMLAQVSEERFSALWQAAEPYLNTDMTGEEIQSLLECTLVETIRAPGETKAGALHAEFYVDADALQAILLRLFYTTD